jgi:signal transduction histidine kinase
MSASTATTQVENARRIEELGRIIIAYSEVTEKLQQSHDQLTQTVRALQAELGEKNRLLERKNRLAALGEMAAGLAHEIRNPLGGIQLYASMLAQDVVDRPDSLSLVRKVSGGVRRLEALVGQVLQFSREITAQPRPCDLASVVDQAVDLAHAKLAELNVDCAVDGPRPFVVTIDPLLLGQALLNLLLNAAEAAGGGANGKVTVRFARPSPDSEVRQFHLVVKDNGLGIPSAVLDRIFNPFFTTRDGGTGLGLAIVHRVVEAHDGTVTATNEPAGGARFEIRV